jgi:hypothetical protein
MSATFTFIELIIFHHLYYLSASHFSKKGQITL